MPEKSKNAGSKSRSELRNERLKQALRANLRRRKTPTNQEETQDRDESQQKD